MSVPAELRLASDALEVVLLPELGARLHRLRAFGHDLLRTPPDAAAHRDDPFFWGAYPMAPWCNRARPGPRGVAGRAIDLAPNFDDGSAIHGLVSSAPWRVDGPSRLSIERADDERWPWAFAVSLDVSVDASSLRLNYRLTNRSDGLMPAGLGLHPWFRAPVRVRLPADVAFAANTGSATEPEPVTGDLDLRRLRSPALGLDGTWTGFSERRAELAWPDRGLRATLAFTPSAGTPHVALATPAHLDAIAVEPQTHGPDPLRRLERGEPHGPVLLPPGDALTLDLRFSAELARDAR